jgi:hypothetical protein
MLKFEWRIGHFCYVRKVDPGEHLEKIEGEIGRCAGEDHRYDRECRIAALADKSEFALVLLGVAEPARAN